MAKYTVAVKEIHVRYVEVEASNHETAKSVAQRVMDKGEDIIDLDYSHTVDREYWDVYPTV